MPQEDKSLSKRVVRADVKPRGAYIDATHLVECSAVQAMEKAVDEVFTEIGTLLH